jgi:RimJ/RimL family protein N-acetyltransferase
LGEPEVNIRIINTRRQKLTGKDFQALAEIEEHPAVGKWDIPAYGGDMEKATAAFKKSLEKPDTNDEFLVAKLEGRVVGFVGVHRLKGETGEMSHIGEIGIAVHPHYQRKGIGTKLLEACVRLAKTREFKRLEADTLAHNIAMRRLLEKTGFELEGIRKKRIKRTGKYFDEACHAILP